jgi:hypothetical protein
MPIAVMHGFDKPQRPRSCMKRVLTIVKREHVFSNPFLCPTGPVYRARVEVKDLHFFCGILIGEHLDCQCATTLGEAVGRTFVYVRITAHVDDAAGDVDKILGTRSISNCMQSCGSNRIPRLPFSLQALQSVAYGNAPQNGGGPLR